MSVLLPHEPQLPHLATLLDRERMSGVLSSALWGPQAVPGQCDIERVKYRPRRHCLVVYRLQARRAAGDPHDVVRVACRTYPRGGASARLEKARREGKAAAGRVLDLAAQEAVAWVFPRDRKLPHLARLTDPARLAREVVPALSHALRPGEPVARLCDHALVHYVPEHACSVRLVLGFADARCIVYGKTYLDEGSDDGGRSAWANLGQAWQLTREHAAVRVPRPLHYEFARCTAWQAAVAGTPVAELPALDTTAQARLARAIAAFHGLAFTGLPGVAPIDLVSRVRASSDLVGQALPAEGARLSALAARISPERIARLWDGPQGSLHGDLHPGNLLMGALPPALIDLDGLRRGPAALDLGSWAADRICRAALAGVPLAPVHAQIEHFRRMYAASTTLPVSAGDLALATVLALLTERALRAVTRLKPGRLALVPTLLTVAGHLLGATHGSAA